MGRVTAPPVAAPVAHQRLFGERDPQTYKRRRSKPTSPRSSASDDEDDKSRMNREVHVSWLPGSPWLTRPAQSAVKARRSRVARVPARSDAEGALTWEKTARRLRGTPGGTQERHKSRNPPGHPTPAVQPPDRRDQCGDRVVTGKSALSRQ